MLVYQRVHPMTGTIWLWLTVRHGDFPQNSHGGWCRWENHLFWSGPFSMAMLNNQRVEFPQVVYKTPATMFPTCFQKGLNHVEHRSSPRRVQPSVGPNFGSLHIYWQLHTYILDQIWSYQIICIKPQQPTLHTGSMCVLIKSWDFILPCWSSSDIYAQVICGHLGVFTA